MIAGGAITDMDTDASQFGVTSMCLASMKLIWLSPVFTNSGPFEGRVSSYVEPATPVKVIVPVPPIWSSVGTVNWRVLEEALKLYFVLAVTPFNEISKVISSGVEPLDDGTTEVWSPSLNAYWEPGFDGF